MGAWGLVLRARGAPTEQINALIVELSAWGRAVVQFSPPILMMWWAWRT